jgi:hypothetical protein
LFNLILYLAHLQAVLIPFILSIKSIKKFKFLKYDFLIPFGFMFLAFASMFEMLDHTKTKWIYIDHSSFFNWLFYSSLALGLTSFSISVIKSKVIIGANLLFCFLSIISYLIFDKTTSLIFQAVISILLIINWQRIFKDWILVLYPIFGIISTTILGTYLSISGNQIWHIFIGPSGTISVIIFYLILIRSKRKLKILSKS